MVPPLGYDVAPEGGRLILNTDEAALVRAIFSLYAELGSLMKTVEELNRRGWRRSNVHRSRRLALRSDVPFRTERIVALVLADDETGEGQGLSVCLHYVNHPIRSGADPSIGANGVYPLSPNHSLQSHV